MIQLNIDKTRLEDEEYVREIVNTLMIQKIIEGQTQRYKKCFDYYDGIEPITTFEEDYKYQSRVINLTKPIVDIATQTFIGELPDIVTSGKKSEKDKVSKFSQKLYDRQFGSHIYETCHYSSKCGTGFLALYNNVGDTFPRFRELNPKFADCIYDCSLEMEHIMSYYIVESNNADAGQPSQTKWIIYVYTKKHVFAYESSLTYLPQTTVPQTEKQMLCVPYLAWKTVGSEEGINYVEHNFGDIPVVEFPNNAEYKGDSECVFDLIALYNEIQNNRCKNVYDIVNYILFLRNVRLGDEEETKKAIELLKKHHILPSEGENTDAKFLTNPLNQDQMQTLATNLYNLIHTISRVPDLSSVDFSQNASDPIIKIKTKPLLDLCSDKEKKCTEPFRRVLRMVLNWCSKYANDFEEYNFNLEDTRLVYTHALPSNDGDMITMITNLSNSRMANPEILLQQLSFIPSVHDYIKGMNKWNEEVDKSKEKVKNENIKANETNLERQNATPLTKDAMDNKQNFNRGNAQTLSENKVE
jgi:SPP1 family phage portal protein